ncbi:MAG TPA: PEPxxWA-CTERM sorting domain-containing protein [Sphingomonas sp.]|nr:PEPxxWA-CTERM sorting domain-containing protein [Sphingomonas sp.]
MPKALVAILILLYCSPAQAVKLMPPRDATDLHLVFDRKPVTQKYIDIPDVQVGVALELRQDKPEVWQISIRTVGGRVFPRPLELKGVEANTTPWLGMADKRNIIVSAYWTKMAPDGKNIEAGSVEELTPKPDVLGNPGSFFYLSVPEPESWALMVAGFAAVGLVCRKRSERPSPRSLTAS